MVGAPAMRMLCYPAWLAPEKVGLCVLGFASCAARLSLPCRARPSPLAARRGSGGEVRLMGESGGCVSEEEGEKKGR